jgi:enoyl-CoA hydratase/carnithine racemase
VRPFLVGTTPVVAPRGRSPETAGFCERHEAVSRVLHAAVQPSYILTATMKSILIQRDDAILRIGIHRPDKKNALTGAMYLAIADALTAADVDASVRVILLHGSEEVFTSGNDINDFLDNPPRDNDSGVARFLRAIADTKQPLVAAVAGPAVGVGTTMLLHCDLVYAADNAKFALPFVSLGLCPEGASSYLLPIIAGYQRAAELLLLGEPFDATTARELGLVTEIVAPGELIDAALSVARKLAALPPSSVRITKALMKRGLRRGIDEQMVEEARHFIERLDSPEAKEAFRAFLEKRRPDFSKLA